MLSTILQDLLRIDYILKQQPVDIPMDSPRNVTAADDPMDSPIYM